MELEDGNVARSPVSGTALAVALLELLPCRGAFGAGRGVAGAGAGRGRRAPALQAGANQQFPFWGSPGVCWSCGDPSHSWQNCRGAVQQQLQQPPAPFQAQNNFMQMQQMMMMVQLQQEPTFGQFAKFSVSVVSVS